ncbi:unnamed protein product [Mytilus edulis]|uniref:B box-type domain-containing protein n=1 Tax=Mytilus edulis TaxID=6550 RepID=A0A8S3TH36_MYTED|nr:unnamed protein product [Mytilus edulis]
MSTKDYHNLPKFMQEISSQCRDHKKKYELYCSFHACPCCVTCITDKHKNVKKMKPLSDILKQVKSSASVQLFEKDLNDNKKYLDDLDSKQSKLKSKMDTLQQQLKTQANQMSQLQSEFSKMTIYATELQMYVGLREIEKTTSEAAKYLEDLKVEANWMKLT